MLQDILNKTAEQIDQKLSEQPELELELRRLIANAYNGMNALSMKLDISARIATIGKVYRNFIQRPSIWLTRSALKFHSKPSKDATSKLPYSN